MKKLIFLFAFSIAVTNIFAQTDPNQIKKEGNDAFNAKNYPVAYAKFSEYLKQTNNQDSATAYYCGIAADEVKKYAEAVTFFDIAIQKKFNTGNAYARKALALDALKKTDEFTSLHPVPEESSFSHLRCQEIPLLLLPSNLMLL